MFFFYLCCGRRSEHGFNICCWTEVSSLSGEDVHVPGASYSLLCFNVSLFPRSVCCQGIGTDLILLTAGALLQLPPVYAVLLGYTRADVLHMGPKDLPMLRWETWGSLMFSFRFLSRSWPPYSVHARVYILCGCQIGSHCKSVCCYGCRCTL